MHLDKVQIERKLDMTWKECKRTINILVWHLMFDACMWTVDTQRWRHARKAWMLFSYSFSCSEQKVFLLVAFDPTEMPYICQRKGDPTGTVQQSYPHDVILSLCSPSLSLLLSLSLYPPSLLLLFSPLIFLPSFSSLSSIISCAVVMYLLWGQSDCLLSCSINGHQSSVLSSYAIFYLLLHQSCRVFHHH